MKKNGMRNNNNMEQDIISAAHKLFIQKGYSNTTIQDIAADANVNKTLLHYYYRSKDNLFNIVLGDVLKQLYENIVNVLSCSNKGVFIKINDMVDEFISFFNRNPELSIFIASEYARNPEGIAKQMNVIVSTSESFQFFSKQIQKEYEKGIIRQTDAHALMSNILPLCSFPIIAQSTILNITGELPNCSHPFSEPYKNEITDLIINVIKPSVKQYDV